MTTEGNGLLSRSAVQVALQRHGGQAPMPRADGSGARLAHLRRRVVELSSVRFDKFYHHSTATHIIRQLEGAEFGPFAVKGYGEFADEAYAHYVSNLVQAAKALDEATLSALERRLGRFPPVANRKFEIQVELPTTLSEQLAEYAKQVNQSVGFYVARMIAANLPSETNGTVLDSWYKRLQEGKSRLPNAATSVPQTTVTLPVDAVELERLQRVAAGLHDKKPADVLHDVILAQFALDKSRVDAHSH